MIRDMAMENIPMQMETAMLENGLTTIGMDKVHTSIKTLDLCMLVVG